MSVKNKAKDFHVLNDFDAEQQSSTKAALRKQSQIAILFTLQLMNDRKLP